MPIIGIKVYIMLTHIYKPLFKIATNRIYIVYHFNHTRALNESITCKFIAFASRCPARIQMHLLFISIIVLLYILLNTADRARKHFAKRRRR